MFTFTLALTVCIRIVADLGTRIFQVTTNFYAGYNAHICNSFGYYFYTLLCTFIPYLNPLISYLDTKFQTNSDVFCP